jgi:hypothetical protein
MSRPERGETRRAREIAAALAHPVDASRTRCGADEPPLVS